MKKRLQLSIFLTSLFIGQAHAQSFGFNTNFNTGFNNGFNNGCFTGYEQACFFQNNNFNNMNNMMFMPNRGGGRNFSWTGSMPLNHMGQRNMYNNRYNDPRFNGGRNNNGWNNNQWNNGWNNNNNFYNNRNNPFFNGRPY